MSTAIHGLYISLVNNEQKQIDLYSHITALEQEYPHFKEWYYNTVLPETSVGLRKIMVARVEDRVAGVLILKDFKEKKICTLRIAPEYRGNGLGHQFMKIAVHELGTKYPLITVSDNHLDEFKKLLLDFDFKIKGMYFDKYIKGRCEVAFNGYL